MNQINLKDRTAIVTGGAQGFGLAITERFLESGANVIMWDIDEDTSGKVLKEKNNPKLSAAKIDVTNFDQISSEIEKISHQTKIDIFVNNAGITGKNATVWDYPIDEWKKVLDLDLNAVFYCCKAVVPFMEKNNYGRIVNIASVLGHRPLSYVGAYSASKAALIQVTKSQSIELARYNIYVNAIAPGYIATDNTKALQENPERNQAILARIPTDRWGTPDDFKGPAVFLASDASNYVSGEILLVDGGWMGR